MVNSYYLPALQLKLCLNISMFHMKMFHIQPSLGKMSRAKKTVPAIGRVGRPVGILVDKRTSIDGICAFGCSHRAYEKKRWPRHAEPCPKCGIYIQRDFEASGCPEVSISGM